MLGDDSCCQHTTEHYASHKVQFTYAQVNTVTSRLTALKLAEFCMSCFPEQLSL